MNAIRATEIGTAVGLSVAVGSEVAVLVYVEVAVAVGLLVADGDSVAVSVGVNVIVVVNVAVEVMVEVGCTCAVKKNLNTWVTVAFWAATVVASISSVAVGVAEGCGVVVLVNEGTGVKLGSGVCEDAGKTASVDTTALGAGEVPCCVDGVELPVASKAEPALLAVD